MEDRLRAAGYDTFQDGPSTCFGILQFSRAAINFDSEEVGGGDRHPSNCSWSPDTFSSTRGGKGALWPWPWCGKRGNEVTLVMRQLGTLPTRLPSTASTFILEK